MKELKLLLWVTQFGLSILVPPCFLLWVAVALRSRYGLGMWIIAVLFAFWINRVMVFQVEGGSAAKIGTELVQFAGGRLVSFFVFEQGLMLLLKTIGVSNFVNRIVVLVFVMVFNYVISKFWIFKEKK